MTEFVTAESETPVFRLGIAVELVNASNGAIDEVDVVAALTGWTHYGWYHAKEEGLRLANHHRMRVELRAIVSRERFEFLRRRLANVVHPATANPR